jgi:threonyl-tRNA synthetase
VSDLRVTVQHAEQRDDRVVTTGTTAGDLFAADRAVIAARIGGKQRDLAYPLADGDVVEPITIDSPDGRAIVRHSTAHVVAQAVQDLFPEAKLGIGPPIQNGFYYDFDVEKPFTAEDLKAIEKRAREIVKAGQRFSRRVVTDDAARAELAGEPYKLELIGLK